MAPGLKRSAITGAIAFWDGQVDDARYVLTLVRTAAHYGAQVASRVQVTGFLREGARVAVADAVEAAAQETVALINKACGQAMTLTGDVTDTGVVEAMVKSVVSLSKPPISLAQSVMTDRQL